MPRRSASTSTVDEVHALAEIPGVLGNYSRAVVKTITSFGPNPSILHESIDALVEHLRLRRSNRVV